MKEKVVLEAQEMDFIGLSKLKNRACIERTKVVFFLKKDVEPKITLNQALAHLRPGVIGRIEKVPEEPKKGALNE